MLWYRLKNTLIMYIHYLYMYVQCMLSAEYIFCAKLAPLAGIVVLSLCTHHYPGSFCCHYSYAKLAHECPSTRGVAYLFKQLSTIISYTYSDMVYFLQFVNHIVNIL